MKVAVCWSGKPGNVRNVWKSAYQYFLGNFDHDLFIHTSEHYDVDADFWRTLNPKIYRVEGQSPFSELEEKFSNKYFYPEILNRYLQQIYGYKRAWQLKEIYETDHNIYYDFVIRCRPDIGYHGEIKLELFHKDKLNIFPRILDPERNQCFTDILVAGSNDIMHQICHIFDWMKWMGWSDLQVGDKWTSRLPLQNVLHLAGRHCPETILTSFVDEHKRLPYRYVDLFLEDVMGLSR